MFSDLIVYFKADSGDKSSVENSVMNVRGFFGSFSISI